MLQETMANIRKKDINQLQEWNEKELRKLRITVKNRIASLESFSKEKELPEGHPLKEMDLKDCKEFLEKVVRAEKGRF